MDGASKFVRGDAVAGILITLINIIGGFAIGVLQRDLTLSESMSIYMLLTVGDGLVTQIPALITSTAAGIIVTRADSDDNLGADGVRLSDSILAAIAERLPADKVHGERYPETMMGMVNV